MRNVPVIDVTAFRSPDPTARRALARRAVGSARRGAPTGSSSSPEQGLGPPSSP